MLIRIRKKGEVKSSEITPESVYKDRRQFLKKSGQFALAGLGLALAGCSDDSNSEPPPSIAKIKHPPPDWLTQKIKSHKQSQYTTDEALTPYKDVTGYNNFYEFGTGKGDPARYAGSLITDPWSVTVEGQVDKPGRYNLEDLVNPYMLEERISSPALCGSVVNGDSLVRFSFG